jgi:hypothetical protein
MSQQPPNWTEEFVVEGGKVVEELKKLIAAGDVRRVIIRNEKDEILIEIPLTPAAAVGGVMVVFAPVLAAVGAMAALLAKVKIQVVRVEDKNE